MPVDLSILDPEQLKAVLDTEGSVLILACAGAGKTRVLASRVAYLIDQGIAPEEILCITFTNKATEEMQTRIANYTGRDVSNMWIGTFHAVCSRILRQWGWRANIPQNFSIYSDTESKSVIKLLLKAQGLSHKVYSPDGILSEISRFKREFQLPAQWKQKISEQKGSEYAEVVMDIFKAYQHELKISAALDFDDLVSRTVRLFQEAPDVLLSVSGQFRYVHVDEYQDTANIEAELVNQLSSVHNNLCVVGDARQSIYGFRGSNYKIIMDFGSKHEGAKCHVLAKNYRSCRGIVSAAESLITHNKSCPDYSSTAFRNEEGTFVFYRFQRDLDEAERIASTVERITSVEGINYSDVAVLCRTRSLLGPIERALIDYNIPYTKVASAEFYSRIEIRCAVYLLRLLQNSRDQAAARYVLEQIGRGIGSVTVDKLMALLEQDDDITIPDICSKADIKGISGPARAYLKQFHGTVADLMLMYEGGASISALVETIMEQSLKPYCDSDPAGNIRWQNLEDLREITSDYEGPAKDHLVLFLQNVALMSDGGEDGSDDKVQLLTIHQAKGLEFKVVFLPGMEEGIMPHFKCLSSDEELEEERRLAYVGMTRATDHLYLSWCNSRMLNGRVIYPAPSRFLEEVEAA